MRNKGVSRLRRSAQERLESSLGLGSSPDLNNSGDDTYVITGIVDAPRHAGRFDILVNGELFAALSVDAIERLKLSVGTDVTDRLQSVLTEAVQLAVYDRALNMLAFRARSSSELARALVRKGADNSHVAAAVARLVEQGFVDDAAFARSFARSRVVGASYSKRRVQLELRRKGVARDVGEAAIADVFDEEGVDEGSMVEAAARRKLRTLASLEPAVRRRRLYGFLTRKGFDSSDIRSVMQTLEESFRTRDGA